MTQSFMSTLDNINKTSKFITLLKWPCKLLLVFETKYMSGIAYLSITLIKRLEMV